MGALWMLVAGLLFAVMGVFVKLGSAHFSSAELVFYRSFISLILMVGLMRARGLPAATPHRKMHVLRGLSGFFSLMLYFYAISLLPLASAVTLNYTSPLFLALFTIVIMRERPQWPLIVAVIVGFVGVGLLLRPAIDRELLTGGLVGLASGFLAGIAYLNVRQLGELGEPEWRIVFYFTLISTVGAGIWMLVHEFHAVDQGDLLLLLGLGSSATIAQLAMTRAYRTGNTLVVGALAYSTVLFATVFGIVLWQEMLPPLGLAGAILIVLSGIVAVKIAPRAPAATD
ncbi:MAG: DMT family transporter [Burkholderiales bacterium]|nr:DMT family transporter [Pseudomonadota bacterium]